MSVNKLSQSSNNRVKPVTGRAGHKLRPSVKKISDVENNDFSVPAHTTVESLHPDESVFGPALKLPFSEEINAYILRQNSVFEMCHPTDSEVMENMHNWEIKRKALLQNKEYSNYLMRFDSHKRGAAFLEIYKEMPDSDYWKCLGETWRMIEVSYPDRALWLKLFSSDRLHRNCLMEKSDWQAFDELPEVMNVFRGYTKGIGRSGLSWTLSEMTANFFATEYASGGRRELFCGYKKGMQGMVVTGKCRKHDVLGYFNGREEQEIVINPEKVFSKRSWEVVGKASTPFSTQVSQS